MERIQRREALVFLVGVVIFLALLFPALMYARRETRDGIRRNEIAAFKQVLEQYYNTHETYPRVFDASPHEYVVSEADGAGAKSWYLRAQLENKHTAEAGYDEDEGRKYNFRLVQEGSVTFYEVCGGTPECGNRSD